VLILDDSGPHTWRIEVAYLAHGMISEIWDGYCLPWNDAGGATTSSGGGLAVDHYGCLNAWEGSMPWLMICYRFMDRWVVLRNSEMEQFSGGIYPWSLIVNRYLQDFRQRNEIILSRVYHRIYSSFWYQIPIMSPSWALSSMFVHISLLQSYVHSW